MQQVSDMICIVTNFLYSLHQVNELQAKIKETTRKMMALVSELSMQQASAMKLQQEVKEREADLEQCYMRMEKGEAPSGDMEREWTRIVRDAERRSKERDEATMVTRQTFLPGLSMLTAAKRSQTTLVK